MLGKKWVKSCLTHTISSIICAASIGSIKWWATQSRHVAANPPQLVWPPPTWIPFLQQYAQNPTWPPPPPPPPAPWVAWIWFTLVWTCIVLHLNFYELVWTIWFVWTCMASMDLYGTLWWYMACMELYCDIWTIWYIYELPEMYIWIAWNVYLNWCTIYVKK